MEQNKKILSTIFTWINPAASSSVKYSGPGTWSLIISSFLPLASVAFERTEMAFKDRSYWGSDTSSVQDSKTTPGFTKQHILSIWPLVSSSPANRHGKGLQFTNKILFKLALTSQFFSGSVRRELARNFSKWFEQWKKNKHNIGPDSFISEEWTRTQNDKHIVWSWRAVGRFHP